MNYMPDVIIHTFTPNPMPIYCSKPPKLPHTRWPNSLVQMARMDRGSLAVLYAIVCILNSPLRIIVYYLPRIYRTTECGAVT